MQWIGWKRCWIQMIDPRTQVRHELTLCTMMFFFVCACSFCRVTRSRSSEDFAPSFSSRKRESMIVTTRKQLNKPLPPHVQEYWNSRSSKRPKVVTLRSPVSANISGIHQTTSSTVENNGVVGNQDDD